MRRNKKSEKYILKQKSGEGRRRVPQLKWRWQERGLAPGGPRIFLREEEEPGGGPLQTTLTNTTPDPAPINYR